MVRTIRSGRFRARAGLQANDPVAAIDGAPVRNSPERRNKIGPTPVGKRVDLIHASGTAGPGPSRSRRPATLAISMPR
ncbi:S1-C subfamily serine protease [Inquilinus ginsengisoli]|uniref:hypothetical protein n=1 Tax=Inquilinus ginsengisoli TaxID=363840 RepID=UPI003D1BBF1E